VQECAIATLRRLAVDELVDRSDLEAVRTSLMTTGIHEVAEVKDEL
jgi:hypothetical protein